MITKAIEKIVELAQPNICNINGDMYTDRVLHRVDNTLRADPFKLSTLSGFVDYIKGAEADRNGGTYIVQVVSPTKVSLISYLDDDRRRECLVMAEADLPDFRFGEKISQESFIIAVQAMFVDGNPLDNDKELILKFAGTVKAGTVTDYKDDGISQKAVVKTGVKSLVDAEVPNPCNLAPYRTFTEVEQPISKFIFRMFDDDVRGVCCGLYEADGGAWRSEAMNNVKAYLADQLKDVKDILIIS